MRRDFATLVKFVMVGGANTVTGLSTIYLCKWLFGFGDVTANICGYALGLALSFLLNRNWTFRHAGPALPALARFLSVFAVAYSLNLATVVLAVGPLNVNAYLAQAIGIAPYTIFFFVGSRYFAFRPATS